MNTPFPYDRLTTNTEFSGRKKELQKLQEIVKYSNNLLIHSKRRMGKTSLIKHFFNSLDNNYISIYVDIFDISTKEDFAKALLVALSNAQKLDIKSTIKKLSSLFKRVRVEPTINPETLEYSIKPIIDTLTFEQMIEDFFHGLQTLSKEKQIAIAIDEFQQIATIKDLKLDAIMRKHIQERENISYIFLGSKRHLLTSLFEYKAPLYELATHLELNALEIDEIEEYVTKYLNIDRKTLLYICEISDYETKMIQNIFHLLYIDKKKLVETQQIDEIVKEIINSKDSSYKIVFDTLNNNQKTALKIVVKYRSGFFANVILNEYNIKKQTLQSAVDSLFKKELIDKNGAVYFIPDRTFELWARQL